MITFVIAFLNTRFDEFLMFMLHVYTASKVKHRLNFFYEKTVKLSKYEFILVIFFVLFNLTSHQHSFSNIGTGLPWLNQY